MAEVVAVVNKSEHVEEQSITRSYKLSSGLFFNADHGFLEAIVRGLRSGFLKSSEYRQICQCTTFDDVKLALGDTDYSGVLGNINQKLTKEKIMERCTEHFVSQFKFIRKQAVGSLSTFMDFISYEHLIDNISFLISSLIQRQGNADEDYVPDEIDTAEMLAKCNPLGYHPQLKTILAVFENSMDSSGDGLMDLYRTVLVDMPVAKYFGTYFKSQNSLDAKGGQSELSRIYTEGEFEVITNNVKKLWLEDFYQFCKKLGGDTAIMMSEFLEFEADYRSIEMTMNSFGTALNDSNERDAERKGLFPNIGKLYPRTTEKKWQDINDVNRLGDNLVNFFPYEMLWNKAQEDGKSSDDVVANMSDLLKEYEIKFCRLAFDDQSHFSCFYGWAKLKQAELRNLRYILSCIGQRQTDPKILNKWIPAFPPLGQSAFA